LKERTTTHAVGQIPVFSTYRPLIVYHTMHCGSMCLHSRAPRARALTHSRLHQIQCADCAKCSTTLDSK